MLHETVLHSEIHSPAEFHELLLRELRDSVSLQLKPSGIRFRGGVDPAILVAVATSPALVTLVTGILRIIETKVTQSSKIRICGYDGRTLEVDSSIDAKKLREILAIYDELGAPRIEIVRK